MPINQALSLCPQTKLNDELNHDKDSHSVPTGFWDQGYWGERSAKLTKKTQIKRSAASIKSIKMAEDPGAELPDDLPTAQCEKNLHDSAPARYRHGSRGRKVRYSQLCAPFAPHRQPFTTPPASLPSSLHLLHPHPQTAPRSV